jgi:hypothetical protein
MKIFLHFIKNLVIFLVVTLLMYLGITWLARVTVSDYYDVPVQSKSTVFVIQEHPFAGVATEQSLRLSFLIDGKNYFANVSPECFAAVSVGDKMQVDITNSFPDQTVEPQCP